MSHIGIAGAGIGGLAAALALADPARRITLFDRATALEEVGAGLQLSPNACVALRRLGVLDHVQEDAVRLTALRVGRGRDDAALATMQLGEAALKRFGAPFLVTRRADLHRALRRRVEALPDASIILGAGIEDWTYEGSRLRLRFQSPDMEPMLVDALVGADGLHSAVRRRAVPHEPPARHRGTAWRTTIEAAKLPEDCSEPWSNLWLGHGAHIVHYPVARGRLINVVAAIDGDRNETGPGDPAWIAARFSAWAEPLRRLIASAESWGQWPLVDRPPLPRWSDRAVTLLGDAAHPMLPFLAQGAAQALEDAVALGEAVAASSDLPQAFQAYEERRRGRATRVQADSRRQAFIYHLPWPASSLRDVALRSMSSAGLLNRYAWLYGGVPSPHLK